MKVAAVCVWGAVLAGPLAAQETGVVYGRVADTAGRAVPHATVRVLSAVASAPEIASTDERGEYRLAGVGSGWVALQATLIGYVAARDSVLVTAGDSVRVDFRMVPSAILLGPTIVTAAKRSQLLDQAVTSVSVVSERQIAQRAVNTVDEAVDKAPGVQLIQGQVNIRGSSGFAEGLGSRVLLLVDGVPANQGDRGGINWDIVPVDRVERVEVVKGAGSALYGSAAFGGVVNLITRELPEGWHAHVRTTGGVYASPPHDAWRFRDYTGIQGGIDLGASYGRGSARGGVSAGARHSDGYRQQDRADHWQATSTGEWHPDPVTVLRLSGAWASDQYQVPEPWCVNGRCRDRGESFQPFLVDTVNNLGNRTRSDKGHVTALVSRTPSERLQWLARGSWLRTHFTNVYPKRQPPLPTSDYSIADRYGAEVRLVTRPDADRVVTVGAEAARSDVLSNIFSGDTSGDARSHTQDEFAAYGEAEHRFGSVRLTLGARTDLLVVDGDGVTAFVSPRAGIVWPTATGAWRASAGRAFRAPSLAERFVTTYALGFRVIPNPALGSEEGWSVEAGRSWVTGTWLRGDAAAFWTEARRLIEPTFTPGLEIQFQNLQRARILGLDLAVTAAPMGARLTASLSYQYLHARELATDSSRQRPLLFRPRHLLTLTGDYAVRPFSVGVDLRYSSRYERGDPLFTGDRRVAAKVLDLRASWIRGPLAVHARMANALNYIYNFAPRVLEPVRTTTLTLTLTY